eukprot:scaffold90494_cov32-Prasinocladus_malaysianus.AAC.1
MIEELRSMVVCFLEVFFKPRHLLSGLVLRAQNDKVDWPVVKAEIEGVPACGLGMPPPVQPDQGPGKARLTVFEFVVADCGDRWDHRRVVLYQVAVIIP